jgi:hypothetical protein
MRVLVCGGRDYQDREAVDRALDHLHSKRRITLLIDGGQTGADTLAHEWAKRNGVAPQREFAKWGELGGAAGPIRNKAMLDKWKPEGVVAFPGHRGTANMIKQARVAGLKVWRPFG